MRHNQYIDWKDEAYVVAYAKQLGKGMTVYKKPDRPNYNIRHTANESDPDYADGAIKPEWVVYRT